MSTFDLHPTLRRGSNVAGPMYNLRLVRGGEPIFVFESTYELVGNVLNITIEEYYNQIYYPKEKFEDFRKVINAAADWNKVVLILKES